MLGCITKEKVKEKSAVFFSWPTISSLVKIKMCQIFFDGSIASLVFSYSIDFEKT